MCMCNPGRTILIRIQFAPLFNIYNIISTITYLTTINIFHSYAKLNLENNAAHLHASDIHVFFVYYYFTKSLLVTFNQSFLSQACDNINIFLVLSTHDQCNKHKVQHTLFKELAHLLTRVKKIIYQRSL